MVAELTGVRVGTKVHGLLSCGGAGAFLASEDVHIPSNQAAISSHDGREARRTETCS